MNTTDNAGRRLPTDAARPAPVSVWKTDTGTAQARSSACLTADECPPRKAEEKRGRKNREAQEGAARARFHPRKPSAIGSMHHRHRLATRAQLPAARPGHSARPPTKKTRSSQS